MNSWNHSILLKDSLKETFMKTKKIHNFWMKWAFWFMIATDCGVLQEAQFGVVEVNSLEFTTLGMIKDTM